MIIKKYKAATEKEAIIMAKEDLGSEAIVMNVKTIKPNGILKLFRKPRVELTAAIDDNISQNPSSAGSVLSAPKKESYRFGDAFDKSSKNDGKDLLGGEFDYSATNSAIEEKINSIAKLLEAQMTVEKKIDNEKSIFDESNIEEKNTQLKEETPKKDNKIIDLIYSQLLDNEVKKEFVDNIVGELDYLNDNQHLDNVLSSVYQKIVLKLGEIKPLTLSEKKPKIIFFVGNTGVGKTTTVAKLASKSKIEDKLKVALFSVDTYRIAAIEQLKIYANIINAPMEVIYTPENMEKYIEKYNDYDYIFVDTAGRSHKDAEQKKDLQAIIDSVGDNEKDVYLVVSATVKYNDLVSIAKTYEDIHDFKLIFTKLDETTGIGSILNLKMELNKDLSYVTWGQNVPDDIGVINPQVIAKKLLGGAK